MIKTSEYPRGFWPCRVNCGIVRQVGIIGESPSWSTVKTDTLECLEQAPRLARKSQLLIIQNILLFIGSPCVQWSLLCMLLKWLVGGIYITVLIEYIFCACRYLPWLYHEIQRWPCIHVPTMAVFNGWDTLATHVNFRTNAMAIWLPTVPNRIRRDPGHRRWGVLGRVWSGGYRCLPANTFVYVVSLHLPTWELTRCFGTLIPDQCPRGYLYILLDIDVWQLDITGISFDLNKSMQAWPLYWEYLQYLPSGAVILFECFGVILTEKSKYYDISWTL